MMGRRLLGLMAVLVLAALAARATAEDLYFWLPVTELQFAQGEPPRIGEILDEPGYWQARRQFGDAMAPHVQLDGPGEAYIETWTQLMRWGSAPPAADAQDAGDRVAIRAPGGATVRGRIVFPKPDWSGMETASFELPPGAASSHEARVAFLKARERHFDRLLERAIPGAAWFRHEREATVRELAALGERDVSDRPDLRRMDWDPRMGSPRASGLEASFDFFSGGRALSENLQLDRELRVLGGEAENVAVDSLPGIDVREIDWAPLLEGVDPELKLDALAAAIPADQHALFFPSFAAMTELMDEADRNGTPILELVRARAEDARTRERYQRQLCLSTDALSRLVGPRVIAGVAFTGGDPFLPTGSDVAVLFAAHDGPTLRGLLAARQAAAAQAEPAAEVTQGEIAGVAYQLVRTPDRSLCSYLAQVGPAVVVSNSPAQLERIIRAGSGVDPALGGLAEYRFFRDRYRLGDPDETALLVVSDAAIRRWCGPRWRIGAARRVRAAATLAELQARRLAGDEAGTATGEEVAWTAQGPLLATYGSLAFQTPIAELELDRVTAAEARAYAQFRDMYQANWSWAFDPIAIRFGVGPQRLALDLTVMPLILGSDYREMIEVTRGATIEPGAGDPHAEALAHFALAINRDSQMFQSANSFLSMQGGGQLMQPLGWLGQSAALYLDDDSFWAELVERGMDEQFLGDNLARLPVALWLAVDDPLRLASFLTALRAFAQQSAPGLTRWETIDPEGQPYVRVRPATPDEEVDWSIFYAATPTALIVSPSEAVIRNALTRQQASREGTAGISAPWLGGNFALTARAGALQAAQVFYREDYQAAMQLRAWGNLPILNQWRRMMPGESPVAAHERLWQARLVDPAGGEYVWNEAWQTMESSVYGHPGQPRRGPDRPTPLAAVTQVQMGLTFEHDGLRVRAEVDRDAAAPQP